jgi:apolipoprotein N-acyltransferase
MTQSTQKPWHERPAVLLLLGAVLTVLANLQWGVGALAWVAAVPWLRHLRLTRGVGSRALFVLTSSAAWVLATAKIVSEPLPWAFALLGVPFGLLHALGFLAWDGVRRRLGELAGVLMFPTAVVAVELLQYRMTSLGNWGAAANTQLGNLALLQLASLTGAVGVSFVVQLVAASLESLWSAPSRAARHRLGWALASVALAHAYGAARLSRGTSTTTRVAAIATDASFDGRATPDAATRARTLAALLENTRRAAQNGAQLAVWTEAAALVMPDEENAFVSAVAEAARRARIHVVAAYIVPVSERPLRYENKYRWLRPDGSVDHTYFKHEPAPGEPSVVGSEPMRAVQASFGRLGGAICYDYDFPALAREHGLLGLDLVALPSSDWRGIDPIHTQMAALRAIEQGFSIVRSTRFGLAAGIDPYGRMRAQQSAFDGGDALLVMELPRHGFATPYRRFGDAFGGCAVLLALGLLALAAAQSLSSSSASSAAMAAASGARTARSSSDSDSGTSVRKVASTS